MPNYTYNTLTLKGRPQTLQRVYNLLRNGEDCISFEKLIPCPEKLKSDDWQSDKEIARQNLEQYGYEGWYDWRVAKWGTKWEACQPRFENGVKGCLVYCFDTAWSPPEPFVAELSRRFPSLDIFHEAHEEACMFDSFIKSYKGGVVVKERAISNINIDEEEEAEENNLN